VAAGLVLAGCQSKLSSTVTLDGKPFSIESCRSGEASGFHGVDLIQSDGTKLRLVAMPNGQAAAHVFAPGAATSIELGACGTFSVQRQNSRINNIHNVMGSANLSCTKDGRSVGGSVTFENCH
jgi:hypothetical protein